MHSVPVRSPMTGRLRIGAVTLATLAAVGAGDAAGGQLPTRYVAHLGDIERVGAFYGVLQLGLFNRVGRVELSTPDPRFDPGGALLDQRLEAFEGRFVGLTQLGLYNRIYRSAYVGVRVGVVNMTGSLLGPEGRYRGLIDAGLVNLTFGHHAGLLQLGAVNHASGFLGVAQLGGWNSIEGLRIRCLVQAGALNWALKGSGARVGMQIGGLNALASAGDWRRPGLGVLQLGAVNVGQNALVGLQLGVVNVGLDALAAGQIALFNLVRGRFAGAAVGVVNAHRSVRGVQLGLVNYAGNLRGVQLGLLNVAGSGGLPVTVVLNIGF